MTGCVRHPSGAPGSMHQGWLYIAFQPAFDTTRASRIRRAIHDDADACCAVLCSHPGLSRLDIFRVVQIGTRSRTPASLLNFNEPSTHLRTGDRLVRLDDHGNRSSKGSGNDDGLNQGLRDDLPRYFVLSCCEHPCS